MTPYADYGSKPEWQGDPSWTDLSDEPTVNPHAMWMLITQQYSHHKATHNYQPQYDIGHMPNKTPRWNPLQNWILTTH
jgi:hypothetical protein